jgi:hypothetical protein
MTGEGNRPASSHIRNVLQTMHRLHKLGRVNGKKTANAFRPENQSVGGALLKVGRTQEYIVEW